MEYPQLVLALREFGLITEEQAERAYQEWDAEVEDWERRFDLAQKAWEAEMPWWKRIITASNLSWKFRWMDEHP